MAGYVPFLTIEDGDDLIVSFGLGEHAATSLTLLRTPKYEYLLPEEARGVSVGTGPSGDRGSELLVSVHWRPGPVHIQSTARSDILDIKAAATAEIKDAKRVLRNMNFDHGFEVKDVQSFVRQR
jgi:hypothetical protein